jgi:hypothetical protein
MEGPKITVYIYYSVIFPWDYIKVDYKAELLQEVKKKSCRSSRRKSASLETRLLHSVTQLQNYSQ